jgi:hypothetical protein
LETFDSKFFILFGFKAKIPPIIDPIDVPPTISTGIPCSYKALISPIWAAPLKNKIKIKLKKNLAPPPPKTNPTTFEDKNRPRRAKSLWISIVNGNTWCS